MTAPTGTLDGWSPATFSAAGLTHRIFSRGPDAGGPGVLVIPEIPGISPEVLGFADHLVAGGFRVVIASLFGVPGKPATGVYTGATVLKLCVSREMRAFAVGAQRPVSRFLRALAADLAAQTGGRVGVVGMCFTGGFALATAVEPTVAAAVVAEPAVPFPVSARHRADIGLSPDEQAIVRSRSETDLCLLGLRFSQDKGSPAARFESYRRAFPSMRLVRFDSSPGNPGGYPANAHSVLTHEVRTDPANSASHYRDEVLAFLRDAVAGSGCRGPEPTPPPGVQDS